MISRIFLALALALVMIHPAAFAQVGPKDGANLPATDLDRIKVGQPAPDFTGIGNAFEWSHIGMPSRLIAH